MKKSALKEYIREEIIKTLSEMDAYQVTGKTGKKTVATKAKDELALLTREMKALAKKYKEAKGEEKAMIFTNLSKKTALKNELEAIVYPKSQSEIY